MKNTPQSNYPVEPDIIAKHIVQNLSDSVIAVDLTFNVLFTNQAFVNEIANVYMVNADVGTNIIESFSNYPLVQSHLNHLFESALNGETVETNSFFEKSSYKKIISKPTYDDSGGQIGICLILNRNRDKLNDDEFVHIPKSKSIELEEIYHKYSNNQNILKIIGDSIPYGIWICDINGELLYASDSFLDLIGMSLEEAKKFGWTKKMHPDDIDSTMKNWLECIESKNNWDSENRIVDDTGKIHYILTRGRPIYDSNQNVICWCGINLDITQRKEAEILLEDLKDNLESEIEKRTKQLRQQRQNLRSLAMQISIIEQKERKKIGDDLHDYLAQMLVIGSLDIRKISKKLSDEEFAKIKPDIDHLQQIINDSLNFTRNVIKELTPQTLYKEGLIPSIQTLSSYFKNNGLNIWLQDNGAELNGLNEEELLLLYQSIREILFNIFKHAKTTEAFVQFSKTDQNELIIKIHDHGIGFDVEQAMEKSVQSGHFGLFTVQERIKALGGILEITSKPNEGSQFFINLKIQQKGIKHISSKQNCNCKTHDINDSEVISKDKIRIVLADDASIVRHGLVNLIEDIEDFEVIGEAANGQEALEMSLKLKPHVVLMDVNMPLMNGIEATERLKKVMPTVNVIGLSVNDDIYTKESMQKAGASAYLQKDGEPDDLFNTIRKVHRDSLSNPNY